VPPSRDRRQSQPRLSRKIVFLAPPAHPGRRNLSSSWIRPRPAGQLAALEIIDRDGAGGLSMRRLARALNRDPMMLCPHARRNPEETDDLL
jgi:hypothetical protein